MKLSLNWLREFIDLPETAAEIGEKITIHTAELEEIIDTKKLFSQIMVGKLQNVKPHSESEKLSIGLFDFGEKNTKQIVFGEVHPLIIGKNYPLQIFPSHSNKHYWKSTHKHQMPLRNLQHF